MKIHGTSKKIAAFVMALAVALSVCMCAGADQYRTLKQGDSGKDVIRLKERMYALGYFTTTNFSDKYTGVVTERVKQLQKANGLEETGIATPELQELIFSDDCVWVAPTPVPTAAPTPVPPPAGPVGVVRMPERDAEGFLMEDEPFIHSDRNDGRWIYLSRDIQLDISRYESDAENIIWFETYIKVRDGVRLESMLVNAKTPGVGEAMPTKITKDKGAVFGFTDDFYGHRVLNKIKPGVIVRNGKIMYDKTRNSNSTDWPPLDILAVYPDGSMKTFVCNEHTAQEYVDMGVIDTYAFGPILVQNGELCGDMYNWSQTNRDPRMALGMIAPNEYCVLTVTGRRKDSKGATIQWTGEKIKEMGAVEALNLDGGNTTCLVFMDEIINRPENVKNSDIRRVGGMIGLREKTE